MKIRVIPEDGYVLVDGVLHQGIEMDCVEEGVHMIFFDTDTGESDVQKWVGGNFVNDTINSFNAYQPLLDQWNAKEQERIDRENDPFYGMTTQEARVHALETKLAEIDLETQSNLATNFTYANTEFYAAPKDVDFIMATLARSPSTTVVWKSASKEADGVTNKYVQFTPAEFKAFADALYDDRAVIWAQGDAKKGPVKAMYNDMQYSPQDIWDYVI